MKSCTLPLKWPKVLGPPKWAQTQQDIPLVLDTSTWNTMVEGRAPVHRRAVPTWLWGELIRETADLRALQRCSFSWSRCVSFIMMFLLSYCIYVCCLVCHSGICSSCSSSLFCFLNSFIDICKVITSSCRLIPSFLYLIEAHHINFTSSLILFLMLSLLILRQRSEWKWGGNSWLSLTDTETPVSPNCSADIVIIIYILLIFGCKRDFNIFFHWIKYLLVYVYLYTLGLSCDMQNHVI